MSRYFLKISYDGTAYAGWQSQTNAISVQQVLQEVMEKVLRQQIKLTGSSRTDAGVHAAGQVAQADFSPEGKIEDLVFKINMALPEDIALLEIREVRPDAQSRFEAVSRTYRYSIQRQKNPIGRQFAHSWLGKLNLAAMEECCRILVKHTDFEAFSKVHTQVTHFECRIEQAFWKEENGQLIFQVKANRFLRGMVRALVGTMLEVGKGKRSVAEFVEILHGKNRRKAGESAPARGLCLLEVAYPDSVYL